MSYIPGYSPARSWKKLNWLDLALLVMAVLAVIWLWNRLGLTTQSDRNWKALAQYILYRGSDNSLHPGSLLKGLAQTIRLGFWSTLLALVSGALVGALTANQRGLAAVPANIYINVLRNTPPLILLFLVFFFAGSLFIEPVLQLEAWLGRANPGLRELFYTLVAPRGQLDRMLAAILTLGLYGGAYVAEIMRSGLESIPKDQLDASAAQGLSKLQQYRYIVFPQALRLMLPQLIGQIISIFKETTLASIISLPELTFQSMEVMSVSRITVELWLAVAGIYLLLSLSWASLGEWLERRRRWQPII